MSSLNISKHGSVQKRKRFEEKNINAGKNIIA